jgi:hypothetical protein
MSKPETSLILAFGLSMTATSSATGETTRYLIDQRGATLYFKALNDPLANSLGFRGWRDASRAPEYAQALATIREAKEKKRHRMGAMISAAFENKDQDNSQPQFLDVVRERTSYSVEDVGVTIFTKSEIQKVNWGLPCEAPSVADILCRVPNWVKGAREAPGRPGRGQGSQSLWRVVDFALALGMEDGKKKWKAPVASLTRTIRKYFPGALPEWEERRVGLE